MSNNPSRRRWLIIFPIVSTLFLVFVLGMCVSEFRIFPYEAVFEDPFEYAHAVLERRRTERAAQQEAEMGTAGKVTIPAKPGAFDGYTFLTLGASQPSTAILIDMDGKIVHRWRRQFREIWPDPPQRLDPSPDTAISWRYAELFPNGDILTVIKAHGDTPDGYGLVKLDKDSNVIWASPLNFHHHFSIARDGRIFGTIHDWRDQSERPLPDGLYLPPRVMEDFVVELSPDGEELSRVSLLDAMTAPHVADYVRSAFMKGYDAQKWDPLHPNDVEIIEDEFAAHHPFLKPGMVMLSLRDLDALVVLDMQKKEIVRVARGPWVRQHDPDLLPDGSVLLFDNRGHYNFRKLGSRILEIDLQSGKVLWSYVGNETHPFYSDTAAGQERLPNGNTLVAEDDSGRLFEVTREGEIVWEYRTGRLHHAIRVSRDWLQFEPQPPAD